MQPKKRTYDREELRRIRQKVMTLAAGLIKYRKYDRSRAVRVAWHMVRQRYYTKVVGVIFGKRQTALKRLLQYPSRRILITLQHEKDNPHDIHAIAVIVTVLGKGSFHIGYLKKQMAELYALLIQKGYPLHATFEGVTGYQNSNYYGLNIGFVIDQTAYQSSIPVASKPKRAPSRQEVRSLQFM